MSLYQCFLTLPSVLAGKVYKAKVISVDRPAANTCPLWCSRAYLGNLSPARTGVPHLFQAQLLGRRPRCIRAALLGRRALRGGLGVVDGGGGLGRSGYRSWRSGDGDGRRDLGCLLDGGLDRLWRGRHRGGRGGRCGGWCGALAASGSGCRGRGRGGLGGRLLRGLLVDLLGLDRSRLRRVLDMLRLDVLRLDMLLLDVLLGRRALLGLLGEVLCVLLLLLLLLLRMLLDVLGVLDVLGHVLLLLSGMLRHGDRGLDRARVVLLLLMVLDLGLCLCLGLSLGLRRLGMWLGSGICPVVHGVVATVHVGLGILVLGAVPPSRRVSKRRLLLRLHRHRLLGLGRP